MITPSFSLTATERVLPRLALDFTTAILDPRITFTRALNTATRVNSSGYIAPINADLPRFDFDPVTLACKGLLIEESRTNNIQKSELFSDSTYYVRTAVNVTSSTQIDPSGAQNAQKIVPDTTTSVKTLTVINAATFGTTYAFSIYAKKDGYDYLVLGGGNGGNRAFYNLNTGVVVGVAVGSPTNLSISNAGNGWWRCSGSFSTARDFIVGVSADGISATMTGNGTSGVLVYGAQLEAGAFATSYIPTTSAALTRNADVATMTGTNFSDWFNAGEGTFVIQSTIANTTTTTPVQIDDGTNNNRFFTTARLNGVSGTAAGAVNGGSIQANIGNFTFATNSKIALAYKENNFAASVNGANAVTDTSGTIPVVDRLNFMYNNTTFGTGLIQGFRYWPQRLTNAEVQAISKG